MKTLSDFRNIIPRTEYPEKTKRLLLDYMTRRKFLSAASTAKIKDFVTGERVDTRCRLIYSDGEYEWRSEEIYLVEKYNMAISEDFIAHVLKDEEQM